MPEQVHCPQCSAVCEPDHNYCPACGFPIEQPGGVEDPLIGCTLPGGHVVQELIDVGGMGRVYRAQQHVLGRTVAVKIIHPHLLGDATVEARFITEARAASQLNHPNTVAVIDFGKFQGRFYMVMEFLRGRDLATVAYDDGPMPIPRIVDVMCQILAALEEAHHHGIVHRDLKPENVVLEALRSGGDFVKVLDFGLAKVREAAHSSRITNPGMVCGTPQYMAPEQARGDPVDHRADLYACGVLLYELLTTRLPFEAASPNQIVLMHLSQKPTDPRVAAPARNIPAGLAEAVMRALAKDRNDRFQTSGEFIEALRVVARDAPPEPTALAQSQTPTLRRCPSCGAMVPMRQRFCGECGSAMDLPAAARPRMPNPEETPTPPSLRVEVTDTSLPLQLTGRQSDLAWLRDQHGRGATHLHCIRISGPPGIGKTRLVNELLEEMEASQDVVVRVGPDPWRARTGYYALRKAVVRLANLPPGGGEPTQWKGTNPEARAGLAALFDVPRRGNEERHSLAPGGESGFAKADLSQRFVAAEALRWALGQASHRAGGGTVILVAEDFDALDGASQNALLDVIAEPPLLSGLCIITHVDDYDPASAGAPRTPGWPPLEARALKGMSPTIAAALVEGELALGSRAASVLRVWREPNIAPMYVEQLVRFAREGGDLPPAGLADLIALRIERLHVDARRVLQAVAVLGNATRIVQLVPLLPEVTNVNHDLLELTEAGFIARHDGLLGTAHGLIRDVTLVSMPLEVRRQLHSRARRDYGIEDLQLPLEAHALHAYHARESFEALMLLEQVATSAAEREDTSGAVTALRMGLDLARIEMSRGHLDDPLNAVLMFSRKLGDALAVAGKYTDAQGVLEEALSIANPTSTERPRILASLANVAHIEGSLDEADARLAEALRAAGALRRSDLVDSIERVRRSWRG